MTGYSEYYLKRRAERAIWLRRLTGRACRISLALWIAVFGLLYVIEITNVSAKGYEISDLEKRITELANENRQLGVDIARFQSMRSIQERLPETGLVAAGRVQYASAGRAVVVKR